MQVLGVHPFTVSSTLIRPANTTAYTQNNLIASNTAAGSIVVPSFVNPSDNAQRLEIHDGYLASNITTGMTGVQFHIDLWADTPPTFTNGDGGAWAAATGAAGWRGHMTSAIEDAYSQFGDGMVLPVSMGPSYLSGYVTDPVRFAIDPSETIYWSLRVLNSGGFTPISGQTFTLTVNGIIY